ncbi:MAG TPA: hypothetical protein VNX46_04185 [Candidatus Acidoferrum sp.]|nr:hypothetical protein [Candidatus Acidoferrum sp.]
MSWLSGGGDGSRSCWWYITQVTLDHLRPSPEWKAKMDELQLAKDCEAAIKKRLKEQSKRKSQQAEQLRLLAEVVELLQADFTQS